MITVKKELRLQEFETWAGATDTVKHLTGEELETIESNIIDLYPEGLTETELNDILWFERDLIAEWLGYNDYEELLEREEQDNA